MSKTAVPPVQSSHTTSNLSEHGIFCLQRATLNKMYSKTRLSSLSHQRLRKRELPHPTYSQAAAAISPPPVSKPHYSIPPCLPAHAGSAGSAADTFLLLG